MYRLADELGKHPGKEIGACSLAITDTLTWYTSTCAASVFDNVGFVSRSCFKSARRSETAS